MGNKFNLLPQLLPYFPKNINCFYDLFGGSGTVSMNVKANKYLLNDLNNHIFSLYEMFKTKSADEIILYCRKMRDTFGFSSNVKNKPKIAEYNKEPYYKCRDYMNNNPSTLGFYFLTFYSFYNQFRFNKNKFNMPVGSGYFKEESEYLIRQMCSFMSADNLRIYNKSYEEFLSVDFEENDFVYIDCPYSNTLAVYNEKGWDCGNWCEEKDYELFDFLEKLNKKNVKWAMSNCFCNKGAKNPHLEEWCKNNEWSVKHLNMKYASHGIDENETDEVLIADYPLVNKRALF